ncbi:MAG: hypothetical protein H6631_01370 [Anaerolineaceae bacterium]|nr:hypothetical protein [Anaerolineaceae bacterium]
MADANERTKSCPNRNSKRMKSSVAAESTHDQLAQSIRRADLSRANSGAQAAPLNGPINFTAVGNGSVEKHVDLLSRSNISTIQRQTIALQIGENQGNRHLQQVVALVKQASDNTLEYKPDGHRNKFIDSMTRGAKTIVGATGGAAKIDSNRAWQNTSDRKQISLKTTSGDNIGGVIQRYELEGPWNKNDPVHEVLTLMAIKKALEKVKTDKNKPGTLLKDVNTTSFPKLSDEQGHNIAPEKIDISAQQFIRGVIWPDDPKGYLFDDPKGTTNYSSGLMWWEEFDPDEKDEPEELIARSHYGDLQFFHAMASKDKEDPEATKKKIMDWSRFLTDVSTGRINPQTKLKNIPLTKELFPAHLDYTIKKLFGYEKASNQQVRQRAAGALMHLIQDAHAAGHVGRDKKTGDVSQFRSYEHQHHKKHSEKDAWVEGKNLGERIEKTPGAKDAIDKCAQVLSMLDQGASTDDVIRYLEGQIFKLSSTVEKSGPGKEFKK